MAPGEFVTDFLARYLEEEKAAELQPKHICRFMIAQLPQETKFKLKEWLGAPAADLAEGGALKMTPGILKALLCKGIPLDKGYRGIGSEKVFQLRQAKEELPKEWRVVQSDEDEQVAYVSSSHVKGRGKVEAKHPEQKCFGCGGQGHFAVGGDIAIHIVETKVGNIMQVRHHIDLYQVSGSEQAVTLKIMIEEREVAAMWTRCYTLCN